MALLFPIYLLAFFGGLLGIEKFSFCGEYGRDCLRRCAEESGDPKKIIAQGFAESIGRLYFAAVWVLLLVGGAIAGMMLSHDDGGQRIAFAVLLALAAMLILPALLLRRRARRAIAAEQARRNAEAEPPGADASFTIYCLENPRRISTLMSVLVFLCFLLFCGLVVTVWEHSPGPAVFDALVLLGAAVCIALVVRENRRVLPLLRVDRRGITDSGPYSGCGLIPWEKIKSVSVLESAVELRLSLPQRVDDTLVSQIRLSLTGSLASRETIQEKIELFRKLAREEKTE